MPANKRIATYRFDPVLIERWQAWSDALTRFLQSPLSSGVSDREYQTRHRQVLEAIEQCQSQAPPAQLELLQQLELFVAPWVDLDCVDSPRKELQEDLLRKCRLYEAQLGGRPFETGRFRRQLVGLSVIAAFAVLGALLASTPDSWTTGLGAVRHALYRMGVRLEHISFADKIMTGTLLMLILGWWKLRSMRIS